jgi:hypothetical protein
MHEETDTDSLGSLILLLVLFAALSLLSSAGWAACAWI